MSFKTGEFEHSNRLPLLFAGFGILGFFLFPMFSPMDFSPTQSQIETKNMSSGYSRCDEFLNRVDPEYVRKVIAKAAVSTLSLNDNYIRVGYRCSAFARVSVQIAYKSTFESVDHQKMASECVDLNLFGGTAMHTQNLWDQQGWLRPFHEVNQSGGLVPGDILFQSPRISRVPEGHVGVLVGKHNGVVKVAENNNWRGRANFRNGIRDFRILTPLNGYGEISFVGRWGGFEK